jgi:hypothetical protein
MDRSDLAYAAAIIPMTWTNRSRWMHRRCASVRGWLRCDWGQRNARSSSKRRQKHPAVAKVLSPPVGRYHCLMPRWSCSTWLFKVAVRPVRHPLPEDVPNGPRVGIMAIRGDPIAAEVMGGEDPLREPAEVVSRAAKVAKALQSKTPARL